MASKGDNAEYVRVLLDFSVGLSFMLIEYYSTRPHEWKLLQMRAVQKAMMFSQNMACFWWDRSISLAVKYNGMKN